ncbi:hypothetical protein EV361DRAFT_889796 [Lentinula raphanica]|nr:hypothetical protein F5880DRAFT_1606293 [Lentinula raphanica]KAJ3975224.1 hypothetical protein EV361DRAFT_889796 [Lentinula raphanica]
MDYIHLDHQEQRCHVLLYIRRVGRVIRRMDRTPFVAGLDLSFLCPTLPIRVHLVSQHFGNCRILLQRRPLIIRPDIVLFVVFGTIDKVRLLVCRLSILCKSSAYGTPIRVRLPLGRLGRRDIGFLQNVEDCEASVGANNLRLRLQDVCSLFGTFATILASPKDWGFGELSRIGLHVFDESYCRTGVSYEMSRDEYMSISRMADQTWLVPLGSLGGPSLENSLVQRAFTCCRRSEIYINQLTSSSSRASTVVAGPHSSRSSVRVLASNGIAMVEDRSRAASDKRTDGRILLVIARRLVHWCRQ